jgi:hypothetical protein
MLQFGHQKLGSSIPDIAIAFAFNETQPTHGDIDRAQPVHILSTCKFVGFQTTHVNVGHLKVGDQYSRSSRPEALENAQ